MLGGGADRWTAVRAQDHWFGWRRPVGCSPWVRTRFASSVQTPLDRHPTRRRGPDATAGLTWAPLTLAAEQTSQQGSFCRGPSSGPRVQRLLLPVGTER